MEEKIIEISKITHDEELEKILQKYPLEEGYDITVVPIDATREKIIIKKVAFNFLKNNVCTRIWQCL